MNHAFDPAEDVPEDLADRIRAVADQVTRVPAVAGEGTLATTMATVSREEAVEIAREVAAQ